MDNGSCSWIVVLSTRFNICPPYFKVESKITRDFAAQCSILTYKWRKAMLMYTVYVSDLYCFLSSKTNKQQQQQYVYGHRYLMIYFSHPKPQQ